LAGAAMCWAERMAMLALRSKPKSCPAEFAVEIVAGVEVPEAVELGHLNAALLQVEDLRSRADDRQNSEQCSSNSGTSKGIRGGDHSFTPCRTAQSRGSRSAFDSGQPVKFGD